jgi:hypothetical protein
MRFATLQSTTSDPEQAFSDSVQTAIEQIALRTSDTVES